MKIKYKFVTGEDISIEVYGEFEEIMLELDKNLKNNNRKESRRHENLSLFDKDENNTDANVDVYEDVIKSLDRDRLYYAIQKLKPYEQDLIHKLYLDKHPMTQAEYAKILGITENAVKQRVKWLRNKLKKLLSTHT